MKTTYKHFELIVVDNGSDEPETKAYLDEINRQDGIRVLNHPIPFNFSELNNRAAEEAKGEILIFLIRWMSLFVGVTSM